MAILKCKECGHENPNILQYCEKCGAQLPDDYKDSESKKQKLYSYTAGKDIVAFLGGLLLLIGVLSPWIELGMLSKNGMGNFDGILLFLFAIFIIIRSILNIYRNASTPITYAILGFISLLIGPWDLNEIKERASMAASSLNNLRSILKKAGSVDSSQFIGIGIPTVIIGASLLVLTILLKSIKVKKIF